MYKLYDVDILVVITDRQYPSNHVQGKCRLLPILASQQKSNQNGTAQVFEIRWSALLSRGYYKHSVRNRIHHGDCDFEV